MASNHTFLCPNIVEDSYEPSVQPLVQIFRNTDATLKVVRSEALKGASEESLIKEAVDVLEQALTGKSNSKCLSLAERKVYLLYG